MNFKDIRKTLKFAACISTPRRSSNYTLRQKENKLCIYFLGGGSQTLLYACVIEDFENSNAEPQIELLIKQNFEAISSTLAEKLRAERMRSMDEGMTFYDIDEAASNIILKCNGAFYSCDLINLTECNIPVKLDMSNSLGVKRCPSNYKVLAFVRDQNVHIIDITNNQTVKCTNNGENMGSGMTHFVIEEEFDRYDGLWWRPVENKRTEMHLLIEEFDESRVEEVLISNYVGSNGAEKYRYPRTGKPNAVSTLKLLRFKYDPDSQQEKSSLSLDACLELPKGIMELFPGYEYLTNAGWTSDGKYVWFQLITRIQNKLTTFLIPIEAFTEDKQKPAINSQYAIRFCEDVNDEYWVYVNFNTRFLNSQVSGVNQSNLNSQTAIMSHIIDQYDHLVLVSRSWKAPVNTTTGEWQIVEPAHDCFVHLTSGSWVVDKENIWVDENNKEVYFLANRDNDISQYLYKVSYGATPPSPTSIVQLTSSYTDAYIDTKLKKAVLIESSVHQSNIASLTELQSINQQKRIVLYQDEPAELFRYDKLTRNPLPRLLRYPISDDDKVFMYGLLYVPQTPEGVEKKWPTLHYVYGGPGVRIVEDKFPGRLHLFAQKLNHFGFALLVCDGRGSTGRGYKFEGKLKLKMGQVELNDQIYFLKKAAEETKLIDLDRVAIHGSSYGGYMTIMGIFNHNNVYKCGFSCSPVTDWLLYDTAYTERYMGLPKNQEEAYKLGDVISYLTSLPDDKNNILLIAHGGIDENVHFQHTASLLDCANKLGKDIRLLFYPSSRHGISDRLHLETRLISYLHEKLVKSDSANAPN